MADGSGVDKLTCREIYSLVILCLFNVCNYMDRFGIAGILMHIEQYFDIGDDLGGLLQSGLIIAYLSSAPLFGYLSDRYSRRLLLMVSTGIWATVVLISSFTEHYWQFLVCRALLGVCQSGFTTIAPTVIGDIAIENARSKMLSLFNVAIPLGSGLGYIASSAMAEFFDDWQWGLRLTPFINYILTVLLYFAVFPKRGEKEAKAAGRKLNDKTTPYSEDLKYLLTNRSFMLLTCGLTAVTFVTGALAWWAPKCLYYGFKLIPGRDNESHFMNVMLSFGFITGAAGILGAGLGTLLSLSLRKNWLGMDPIICGVGFLLALPLLSVALFTAQYTVAITYLLIFFGQLTMNFNWPIVPDIVLYIVVPTRRGSAVALQIFIQHALGDLWSPFAVGVLAESFKSQNITWFHSYVHQTSINMTTEDDGAVFHRLQLSLFCISFVHLTGVVFFLITGLFVEEDRQRASELSAL